MSGLLDTNSLLGKLFIVILIIVATHFHMFAGIIIVLLYVIISQTWMTEGMTTMSSSKDTKDSKESKESKDAKESADAKDSIDSIHTFRSDHCKNGKLMLDGKEITQDTISTSFPHLKFSGDSCNPCDDSCVFEIVSSNEQLTVEENLRSKDSNTEPVDHENAIKKR
jgi:hypothetical protein